MSGHDHASADVPGHGHAAPDMSGRWLSVAEAVAYCARAGLSRNIKTIRRWAERSIRYPENTEFRVREQDTGFGFRYMIERRSLDLKIRQELEFEAKKAGADTPGQDIPRPDMPASDVGHLTPSEEHTSAPDTPGQAQPSPDTGTRRLEVQSIGEEFLKDQVVEKDRQIGELNRQLERRDEQIMTMLERDRETNILIRGLQDTLTNMLRLEAPTRYREEASDRGTVDNPDGPSEHQGV